MQTWSLLSNETGKPESKFLNRFRFMTFWNVTRKQFINDLIFFDLRGNIEGAGKDKTTFWIWHVLLKWMTCFKQSGLLPYIDWGHERSNSTKSLFCPRKIRALKWKIYWRFEYNPKVSSIFLCSDFFKQPKFSFVE